MLSLNSLMLDNNISRLKKIELLYFNKDENHEKLFQEEKIIYIYSDEYSKSYVFCFYLSLLINDNKDIINYIYNIEYIKDIFKKIEKSKKKLKIILFSKILYDLIINYEGIDYNEQESKDLIKMKTICENNIIKFDILDLKPAIKNIKNKDIDEIYSNIIDLLIIQNKFENYQYIYDIIKDMEIESINITKNMINNLTSFFNNNKEKLKEYEIFGIDDLLNAKKVNFYYILFKYILKDKIYLNQIPFLSNNKKRMLTFIKSKIDISSKINYKFVNGKIEFVLNFFFDLDYFKQFSTAQKTKSSIFININNENTVENNPLFNNLGKEEWVQILNDSTFTLKIGNKSSCEYINIIYGNNNVNINYDYFKKIVDNENFHKQKYFNDFIKLEKFLEELKTIFNNTFNKYQDFNIIINLKFETTFYSGSINIQCNYIILFPYKNIPKIITEYNILYQQNYNSFNTLIREIGRFLDNQERANNVLDNNNNELSHFFDDYLEYLDNIQYN